MISASFRIRDLVFYSLFLVYPLGLLLFAEFSDCSPSKVDLNRVFLKPSFEFLLGTNELGQDMACLIGKGVVSSLKVAFFASGISFVIGGTLGTFAGFRGGLYDFIIMGIVEFFQSFPSLIFVIFIVSLFGGGDLNLIISLSIFGWTSFARISRAESLVLKNSEFILSAYVLGVKTPRIILRYVFPFIFPALLTQLMFSFSAFILAEGSLGFLGLRPHHKISLGSIVSAEIDYILTHPHLVIFPGLAITCLVIFFNLTGQKFISGKKY